jgi:hypothetical protein
MSNGIETHEWRIGELEQRMGRLEAKIQSALYALIANLVGVIFLLVTAWVK